ncbi:MAG: ATP-binding cassette domain-containing protein, partial [Nitrospirota bacterium]
PTLDNGLTAYENLLFHAYLYGMDRMAAKKRIEDALSLVGLDSRKNELVRRFSGGMKRRLEIARGILNYPKVLFMDEPTIGLDPQTRNLIWEFIAELKKNTGITVFMTTHYLEEAEFCDRVAIIDLGKIIASGTPSELKAGLHGDTLKLSAADPEVLESELREKFGMDSKLTDGGITLTVKKGEEALPVLIKGLSTRITSASMTRPTLNDVFLSLTGKNIREEGSDPYGPMRSYARKSHGGH